MKLILSRTIVGAVIALIVAWAFYPLVSTANQYLLLFAGGLFAALLGSQWLILSRHGHAPWFRTWQLVSDIFITGCLVYATGGIASPFVAVLGLVVIASGIFADALLPLGTSVLSCTAYLISVYLHAWRNHVEFSVQESLHILLQVSTLILVGGVMAAIARRHARLRSSTRQVIRQHRELKDLHEHLMQSMHEGVVVLDADLHITDLNHSAYEILGKDVATAEQTLKLLAADIPPLEEFLRKPHAPAYQYERMHDGRVLLITFTPFLEGSPDASWLVSLVDISELRRLERQLIEKEKMAILGEMAAMLAHEIRNPIQTMRHGLELMEGEQGSKRSREVLPILRDEMLRLNRLVGAMLDYSRPMKPQPRRVDIPNLIKGAVEQLGHSSKNMIRWNCVPQDLVVDPDHFRIVLDNLLRNAVDQDPSAPVSIDVQTRDGHWILEVCDQAGGVPEEIRDQLFDPFVTRRSNGIGLGLATVRQICLANDWKVETSHHEQGTCFVISGEMEEGITNG